MKIYALPPTLAVIALMLGCPHPTPDPVYPVGADAGVDNSTPVPCTTYNGKYQVMDSVTPSTIEPGCVGKPTSDVLTVQVSDLQDLESGQWDVVVLTARGGEMHGLSASYPGRRVACRFVVELQNIPGGVGVATRDFVIGETEQGKGRGEATVKEGECLWQSSSILQRVP